MYFKMLKKDIRRKKSMNIILLIFIFLATMFISGSLSNLVVISSGTESFFNKAGIKDFSILTMDNVGQQETGKVNEKDPVNEFLKENDHVEEYHADDLVYFSKTNIELEDSKEEYQLTATGMITGYDIYQQKFFDEENNEITEMEDGTIYVNYKSLKDNELKTGDKLTIKTTDGYSKTFTLAGYSKDAFFGTDLMSSHRFIMTDHDLQDLKANSGLPTGKFYSIDTKDQKAFEKDYNNAGFNVIFSGDRQLVKSTYIMDLVVAGIIMLVSICLIIISAVMLKFTIVFSINEDFKEIGIMKAIGLKTPYIRGMYVVKYLAMAIVGAFLGCIASIPFSKALLGQFTNTILVGKDMNNLLLQIGSSIVVVLFISGSAYLSTGKLKKFSPMDAIRNGSNGERFKKKGIFSLNKSRLRTTTFLACNDVCCEFRKYLVLFVASIVGMWLVTMPVNTINTLRSENIIDWFAIVRADVFISDDEKISDLLMQGQRQGFEDYLTEVKDALEENGYPVKQVSTEASFKLKVRKGEESYKSLATQGLGSTTDQYAYEEGTAPEYTDEVALAVVTADAIHASVGDTVYITSGDKEKPYTVTAIYQSMNNMGEGMRFHEDAELDYSGCSGTFGVQVQLADEADIKNIDDTIADIEPLFPNARVENAKTFIGNMLGGISDQLASLKVLILIVAIAINILVVALMQKMFLIREKGEMGMMKAVGFTNQAIIRWQTKRIALVLFIGILVGTLTGTPFSQITSGQVFKFMGASHIDFQINPLEVYVIYPLCLFVTTVLGCVITMHKVRKISPQETNNIE